MGKIGKVSPETLRSLARQLNVSDKENISLKADNCELELKIVLSDFNFQVTLGNIRPNLNDLGSDVLEATKMLQDHESIIAKLNSLQNDFLSALNSGDENVFEWGKLLNSAFTDVKEKLDQKRIKLIRRIGTEYPKGQSDNNSPPKITKPFRDKVQKFGLPCTFEAEVTANPEPMVTWLFNEGHLEMDHKSISTNKTGSTYKLNISNVGPQHLGKYTLLAKNRWGEAVCSVYLDHVSNHPTPRSFLSPATTNYSSVSLNSDEKRESLSSLESPGSNGGVTKCSPKFISKLRPLEAYEGDSVRFEIRAVGNPEPEVRWFREGVEILNSPDFKISKEDSFLDVYFLEIPEIFKEDAGRFTCVIQNSLGSDQCSATLVVRASSDFMSLSGHGSDLSLEDLKVILPSPLHGSLSGSFSNMMHIHTSTPPMTGIAGEQCMKPYFRAISKDLEVAEGRGARFDAIVAGKPNPDVTWIKDGQLITTNRNYSMVVNEKGVNSLIIHTTSMKDAGTYQCTASNKAGQDWFKVTLTVLPAWSNGRYSPTNSMFHVARVSPATGGKLVSSIARTFHSEERTHHRSMNSRQFHSEERRIMRKNFYKAASPKKFPSTEVVDSVRSTARRSQRGPMFYNKNITYTSNNFGAPQLVEPIAEPEVREGDDAVMSCRISCPGPCNYEWFFNNEPLDENTEKYKMEVQGDRYILTIKSITKSDRGFYQCTVSNDDGEVTCIGRLNPGTQLCRLARSPIPRGSRSPAPSPYTVRHIEEVKLSCTVVGDPKPKLTWYVNDRPIEPMTPDFTIYHDQSTGLAELTIHDVNKYINSTIKCVADNSQGRAETECLLTEAMLNDPLSTDANYSNILIHQITREQNISTIKTSPRFSQRVQPCTVEEGQTVTLTAMVHGRPRPIVTWMKDDGTELVPSDKYSVVFDDRKNVCKLLIHNCSVEDSGEYSCIAYNPTGQSTCSATICICPLKDKSTDVSKVSEKRIPMFHTTLQPKTEITIGEPVQFQCKILRDSTTSITWYFNGVEISSGHNIKEVDGDIVSTLVIPSPKPANTGEYTCRARNLNGESRTTTYLFVKEVSSISRVSSSPQPKFCMPILQTHSEAPPTDKYSNSYNKPPAFSLPLVNRITTEGSEIFFVVRFEGEPLPSIQWFANGNLVTEKTSDCKILTDFNKKESILYIREVFVGDEGEYTCKAENISGVAYSTSHLYIKVLAECEDRPTLYESKKTIDITGKPRFDVELTLVPDYVSGGRHSVTKHLFIDQVTSKCPQVTSDEFDVCRTSEVQKFENERNFIEQPDQPFSETISIDRSDQSVKTLEFEIIHPQPKMNAEIFVKNLQTDSRTSITSEVDIELAKMPQFSETISIDSRDSLRQVIPIVSPPELISQEDSEIRRLTVESEYELMPEPLFSETVAIDTSEVQEILFEALPTSQTSEITVHQDASLKGIKLEAEIILVEEKPQIFSETVTIDKSESKNVILELPEKSKTSEITIQQESTLQGIKMEAEIILEEPKIYSETVSVDKTEDRTLEFTLEKETKSSELIIHQQSMLKGMKVEAEILPEKKIRSELVVETGHAPKFLVELVPTTVMDGSPVEFITKLIARPMPKHVTWYRNEKNCEDIVHIITDYSEETGESHLQIAEVFPEDSGYYTCEATNVHGTSKTTAFLTVAAFDQLDFSSDESLTPLSDVDELEPIKTNVTDSKMIDVNISSLVPCRISSERVIDQKESVSILNDRYLSEKAFVSPVYYDKISDKIITVFPTLVKQSSSPLRMSPGIVENVKTVEKESVRCSPLQVINNSPVISKPTSNCEMQSISFQMENLSLFGDEIPLLDRVATSFETSETKFGKFGTNVESRICENRDLQILVEQTSTSQRQVQQEMTLFRQTYPASLENNSKFCALSYIRQKSPDDIFENVDIIGQNIDKHDCQLLQTTYLPNLMESPFPERPKTFAEFQSTILQPETVFHLEKGYAIGQSVCSIEETVMNKSEIKNTTVYNAGEVKSEMNFESTLEYKEDNQPELACAQTALTNLESKAERDVVPYLTKEKTPDQFIYEFVKPIDEGFTVYAEISVPKINFEYLVDISKTEVISELQLAKFKEEIISETVRDLNTQRLSCKIEENDFLTHVESLKKPFMTVMDTFEQPPEIIYQLTIGYNMPLMALKDEVQSELNEQTIKITPTQYTGQISPITSVESFENIFDVEIGRAKHELLTSSTTYSIKNDKPALLVPEQSIAFCSEKYIEYLNQQQTKHEKVSEVTEKILMSKSTHPQKEQYRVLVRDSKMQCHNVCHIAKDIHIPERASQVIIPENSTATSIKFITPTYIKTAASNYYRDDVKLIYELTHETLRVKHSEMALDKSSYTKEVSRAIAQAASVPTQYVVEPLVGGECYPNQASEYTVEEELLKASYSSRCSFNTLLLSFDFKSEPLENLVEFLERYTLDGERIPHLEFKLVIVKRQPSFIRNQILLFSKEDICHFFQPISEQSKTSIIDQNVCFASKDSTNKVTYVQTRNWFKQRSLSPEILNSAKIENLHCKTEHIQSMNAAREIPKPQTQVNVIFEKFNYEILFQHDVSKSRSKIDLECVPFLPKIQPILSLSISPSSKEIVPIDITTISTSLFLPQAYTANIAFNNFLKLSVCQKIGLVFKVEALSLLETHHHVDILHEWHLNERANIDFYESSKFLATKFKPKCFVQVQIIYGDIQHGTQEIPLLMSHQCYQVELLFFANYTESVVKPYFQTHTQIINFMSGIYEEFFNKLAYQYLESESESEVASSITVKQEELNKKELVVQNTATSKVTNRKEYFIEPIVETNKYEQSLLEYKILETDKASKDFHSSTLFVKPEIKKTFALVSPQTQQFEEEQLTRTSDFTFIQAQTRYTENVFAEKPKRSMSKTYVPVTRVEHEIEENIAAFKSIDKESGILVQEGRREICMPRKEKMINWVTPKVEFIEEKIVLEVVEQPTPERAPKEEVTSELKNSTTKKEEVLVTFSQEFHSEGEEDELFVEARESLDKVEIIPSELTVKKPAKTSHFANVTTQKVELDLEKVHALVDKPEHSSAKLETVELTLTSASKKPNTLQHGACQNFDLKLDYVQNLHTSVNTTYCTGTLINSNFTQSNVAWPQPSLIRSVTSETQQQYVRASTTEIKTSHSQPELVTSRLNKLAENLKPVSHSAAVIASKVPEVVNLRWESPQLEITSASVSKTSNHLLQGASKKLELKLDHVQNLRTLIDKTSCSETLVGSCLSHSTVEQRNPSLIRSSSSETRQHHVASLTTDVKASQCRPELITSSFTKLVENLKPISHSSSVIEIKKPESINLQKESKLGETISLPENIVAKLMRIETLETILYRTSLLEYLMLLEKELSLKSINLEKLAMILSFPEIVSIQTGLAGVGGRPITRVLTNVYFFKLEDVIEKDMSYASNMAQESITESVFKIANKEIQPLAHSFSQLDNRTSEQAISDAISKVTSLVCKPENIVTKINLTKKSEATLYRISISEYVMLLEKALEIKSLNIDSLAVMLPLAELILLQTAKALLNERPITRTQTSIYLLKLENAQENEFRFESFSLSSADIQNEMVKLTEEKTVFSHSSSIFHQKQFEEAVLQAIQKISGIYKIPENIKSVTNKIHKEDTILSRVTPVEYVLMLEKILALNTLNLDQLAHNLQLPDIILFQTDQAQSTERPLSRAQPDLYYFQFEQAFLRETEKPALNIQPIQIPSNLAHTDKTEKTPFGINLVYDYILEDFLSEYDSTDINSLCNKMPGKIESPLDLESCDKRDKPLSKVQLILTLQEAERISEYNGQPIENILVRPSMLIEPMARREKSFKNVFKTFAVAMLAKFNHENIFELLSVPQKPISLDRLVIEENARDRAKINELLMIQKDIVDEKLERSEKVSNNKDGLKPFKKDEENETAFKEWSIKIKPEKLEEELLEESHFHEDWQVVTKKKPTTEEQKFEEWTVTTKTDRVVEEIAKDKKEDSYIFEEWEEETKVPEKETTSVFEEWTVTKKSKPNQKEDVSMSEEWETTVKTKVIIEKELEKKEESDEELISLHEDWDISTKTEFIVEEDEIQKKLSKEKPSEDVLTESMFEEWEYNAKTTYAIEQDHPVEETQKESSEDDTLREHMLEEWETTLKTEYVLEKDVSGEIDSDNESEISTQSLYEEWEFTTVTKTIVEEEFPMKREVVEIRYPQKRGTNIVLGREIISKNIVEERNEFDQMAIMRQTFRRPIFDEEVTCTKVIKGRPLVLSCHIKSSPEAKVEWFKDGAKINHSPSFTLHYENGYSTLTITKLTNRYFGRYSCRATNEIGINESSITLDKDFFGFDLEEINKDYDRITEEESFEEIRETWTKMTDYDLTYITDTNPRQPSFELEITSVTVFDGCDATLACRVFGYPIPSIEWFFRGKKIEMGPDFLMTYKGGYCSLTISEVMQHDQGQYKIRAINECGTAETCIYLTVLDSYEVQTSTFTTSKDKMVRLELTEEELYSSGEETMDMWTVEEWLFYDLTNHYAIEVFMKKEQNQLQLYKYIPYDEESFRLRISSARAALLDTHPYRFPVIIKELPIVEILEKRKAVLECVVEACPEPEITWFKNGKIITSNDRVKITFVNNVCTLTIDEVNLHDEAEYKCEAKNEFGSSFTWGQIYVETVQLRWGRIKNFRVVRKKSL